MRDTLIETIKNLEPVAGTVLACAFYQKTGCPYEELIPMLKELEASHAIKSEIIFGDRYFCVDPRHSH